VTAHQSFAEMLRAWRGRRGLSQLALATDCEISQRHLSFLELERAQPSRDMVDRLASALDIPLRQHNAMLLAAGFAPQWPERDLAAPDLAGVASALDYMLAQQEPFPAVVVDRHWNLLRSNGGAVRLVEFLVGPLAPGAPINLADALVAPNVLRPYLTNWSDVVRHFMRSIEADAAADGPGESAALLERLSRYPGVSEALRASPGDTRASPVLAMRFRKHDVLLQLFTTIATLGTPQDVTLQELRVECFFPMEEATDKLLRSWESATPRARERSPAAADD